MFIKEKDRLDHSRLNLEQQVESIQNEIANFNISNQNLKKEGSILTNDVLQLEDNIDENVKKNLFRKKIYQD